MGADPIRCWVLLLKFKALVVTLCILLLHYHRPVGLIEFATGLHLRGTFAWPEQQLNEVTSMESWACGLLWETDMGLESWSGNYTNHSPASAPSPVPTTTVQHAFRIKPARGSWRWTEAAVNEQDSCQLLTSTGILLFFNSLSSQIMLVSGIGCNLELSQEINGNILRALAPSLLAAETIHSALSPSFAHPHDVSQLLPAPNLILPLNNVLQLIQLCLQF